MNLFLIQEIFLNSAIVMLASIAPIVLGVAYLYLNYRLLKLFVNSCKREIQDKYHCELPEWEPKLLRKSKIDSIEKAIKIRNKEN